MYMKVASNLMVFGGATPDVYCTPAVSMAGANGLSTTIIASVVTGSVNAYLQLSNDQENWKYLASGSLVESIAQGALVLTFFNGSSGKAIIQISKDAGASSAFQVDIGTAWARLAFKYGSTGAGEVAVFDLDVNTFSD